MKPVKYRSIEQLRNLVNTVKHLARYNGADENGDIIYNDNRLPTLTLEGTTKLHGKNASIRYDYRGLQTQSKATILKRGDDMDGFNAMIRENEYTWMQAISKLANILNIDFDTHTLIIYGEYCGKGLQPKVGVSKLDKSFFVFNYCVSPIERETMGDPPKGMRTWYDEKVVNVDLPNVYHIKDFKTWSVTVDFNDVDNGAFQIMTDAVEKNCPVAEKLVGESGLIGEGIVWVTKFKGLRISCKTKGKKHEASKNSITVDPIKVKTINDFVTMVATDNRIEQGITEACDNKFEKKLIGNLVFWVLEDIKKEESDTMKANGLTMRDLGKPIGSVVSKYYMNKF